LEKSEKREDRNAPFLSPLSLFISLSSNISLYLSISLSLSFCPSRRRRRRSEMADEFDSNDAGLAYVRSLIRSHENFPIKGVLFQDGQWKNNGEQWRTMENSGETVGKKSKKRFSIALHRLAPVLRALPPTSA
jgi:hypothetical protein